MFTQLRIQNTVFLSLQTTPHLILLWKHIEQVMTEYLWIVLNILNGCDCLILVLFDIEIRSTFVLSIAHCIERLFMRIWQTFSLEHIFFLALNNYNNHIYYNESLMKEG